MHLDVNIIDKITDRVETDVVDKIRQVQVIEKIRQVPIKRLFSGGA